VRRADNLITFMCRLSWNLGASNSWNPQGLSRPVMGLLYLYLYLSRQNAFYKRQLVQCHSCCLLLQFCPLVIIKTWSVLVTIGLPKDEIAKGMDGHTTVLTHTFHPTNTCRQISVPTLRKISLLATSNIERLSCTYLPITEFTYRYGDRSSGLGVRVSDY
jgi:hypothetical protein